MKAREIYEKETGKKAYIGSPNDGLMIPPLPDCDYIRWLEKQAEKLHRIENEVR